MIRGLLTTQAIIVVILAALQVWFWLRFQWSTIGDRTLKPFVGRLNAKVTISEIGARASWTGPYLEALNIVIEEQV